MLSRRFKFLAVSVALVCAGGYFLSQVLAFQGRGTLAQAPLNVQAQVPPAFVMAVDDSGSMNWESLVASLDGRLSFGGNGTAADPRGFFMLNGALRTTTNVTRSDYLEIFPFTGRGEKRNSIPPIPNFGFARSPEIKPPSKR